ncbi:Phospholip A2 2 domain containing protein [Asbolus verrucosus]|uniref:phospholipase A2 n=1 Tax=Asbolus verrucosus TaxID=1661398 RepID=A0A482VAS0_ASBVE|nr:Phospholip A2 2 domain containing protein [Asbolus verrucosus]
MYDELGIFFSIDACCREHDNCPDIIQVNETKHGLINQGLFTRSHCDCDKQFYSCLKKDNNLVSKAIGFTYFTVLGLQCFNCDYPIISCIQKEYIFNGIIAERCVSYHKDTRAKKNYQWFDNPVF